MQKKINDTPIQTKSDRQAQALGFPIPDWQPRPLPDASVLYGSLCRLEPLSPEAHADSLFSAYRKNADGSDWTYLSIGPFDSPEQYHAYVERIGADKDSFHYAVVDARNGLALGTLALMRLQPEYGVIEVGYVSFSSAMQGSRLATEAHFLLMSHVFDELGYRRYEWKCDSLNVRSRNAAQRLGFQFEGVFRQAMVYKGRNRDTAWLSMIDKDWPWVKAALQTWLREENFDAEGRQLSRLQCLHEQIRTNGCNCGSLPTGCGNP